MGEQPLSKTQVDRLGERLRRQAYGEAELRLLDEYRRTFGPLYDRVVEMIQNITGVPVSGRPAKSTSSIIEKLNRESIRLSQMQDIAGCRIVVPDVAEQDRAVTVATSAFQRVSVVDRRLKPSHGYRAVHVIVHDSNKAVEVQIRTALQHVWAQMCEKSADIVDPTIKYGGGPEQVREVLDFAAQQIQKIEMFESELMQRGAGSSQVAHQLSDIRNQYVANLQAILKIPIESDRNTSS